MSEAINCEKQWKQWRFTKLADIIIPQAHMNKCNTYSKYLIFVSLFFLRMSQIKIWDIDIRFMLWFQEVFNGAYGLEFFKPNAEEIPGETSQFLSSLAKEHSIHLIGGSIIEREHEKYLNKTSYYNTCLVYGPDGSLLAKHRKVF